MLGLFVRNVRGVRDSKRCRAWRVAGPGRRAGPLSALSGSGVQKFTVFDCSEPLPKRTAIIAVSEISREILARDCVGKRVHGQ